MSLRATLSADMKQAMKDREAGKQRLAVIRMAWAAIRNKEIDAKKELDDNEVCALLMKEVKQREDSITEFKKADRTDLVEANEQEIAILRKYLPEQLSDEDLKAMVQETIAATGAKTMKDMGKVMGAVMAKAKGRAEGGKISAFVRELLK
ncbi:MAG: GatB/YqeY domain-containing protein [Acidaminococcaceae bacterium]|jgi:uncharacterized protein YqeY|nr:GatB/YqeY domain-containing protein [Acidaminococcaceae bacterium]